MSGDGSSTTAEQEHTPRDERWYLTDEREFLRRSLADADRGGDASFDEKHHKVEIQNIDLES